MQVHRANVFVYRGGGVLWSVIATGTHQCERPGLIFACVCTEAVESSRH